MQLSTIQYDGKRGWSCHNEFPKLDSKETLILVFGAPEFKDHKEVIQELKREYPSSTMLGCSTAGEISGSHINDHSLSAAIVKFEMTPFRCASSMIKSMDESFDVGKKIAEKLNSKDLHGIFILSDGLHVNGSKLVEGINSIVDDKVIVTGGLAGDGDKFKETWAISDGKLSPDKVVAVGFYGDHIQIGHASRGGWDIFGPERKVTKSKGPILFELDNKPALELYKEYLGERADELPASGLLFPLAIRKNSHDENQLVRTILHVDEATQSLTFAGDVPEGYLAQLMHANFDRLISSAEDAGVLATEHIDTHVNDENEDPILAIAISCVGRRLLLGERTEEETESLLATLPKGSQQVGFYSYGEISPHKTGHCDLHNQTMTVTTLCEK